MTEGNILAQRKGSGSPAAGPERLAVEAVRQWEFTPAQRDGKPVRARATLMWYSAKR